MTAGSLDGICGSTGSTSSSTWSWRKIMSRSFCLLTLNFGNRILTSHLSTLSSSLPMHSRQLTRTDSWFVLMHNFLMRGSWKKRQRKSKKKKEFSESVAGWIACIRAFDFILSETNACVPRKEAAFKLNEFNSSGMRLVGRSNKTKRSYEHTKPKKFNPNKSQNIRVT